ncbi:MAG: hypothetical protein HQ495_12185 [Alphaproteobacteria bacterium]|nr:hypothetical protein [Alphaproteobacteria bacterium]
MIVSDAKAQANRANAQRSTGPRSDAGKATVSRNALSHGLYGAGAPDSGEDRAAFTKLYEDLCTRFVPDGLAETALVARLATIMWRLARVPAAEHAVYADHEQDFVPANDDGTTTITVDLPQLWGRAHSAGAIDSAIARINRHEAHLQRMQQRTLDMLMALQGLRDGVDPVTATKANARAQAKPTAIEAAVQAAVAAKQDAPAATTDPVDEETDEAGMDEAHFFAMVRPLFHEYNQIMGQDRGLHLVRGRLQDGLEDAGPLNDEDPLADSAGETD